MEVLITSGEAYFKFQSGKDRLEGNDMRYFHIPVGRARMNKRVTLYRPHPDEKKWSNPLRQLPVIKYSQQPLAELQITIIPQVIND